MKKVEPLGHVSVSFSGQLLLHCSSVLSLFANTITDHPTPREQEVVSRDVGILPDQVSVSALTTNL